MIAVSNQFKNNCNSDKITYREYIVISGRTIDVKTKMYASAYSNTNFIGKFNINYITFTTENDIQYRNKTLEFYKEVNGEPMRVGTFIVTDIEDSDSTDEVKVTAYDVGLKFAQPYTTELNYEGGAVTMFDMLEEICTNVGVPLLNASITNGDFIIDSNQFVNGETYGDVVSAIASMSCDFATINNNDQLEFIFSKQTDEIIEDYVELDDKRDTWPITSVSIGTSQVEGQEAIRKDQSLIDLYGEHWLIINDCPISYTLDKREELVDAIFNKVKGFAYSSFVSKYSFKPYLTLGDRIQFRNKAGNLVNSIILRITSEYDTITLEAPSITSSTIDYEIPEDANTRARRAEIIANQNTGIISILSNEVDKNGVLIEGLRGDISSQSATLEIISRNVDEKGNITEVTTTNGIKLDKNGLNLYSSIDDLNTQMTPTGTYYRDGDEIISQTTKDNVITRDLVLYGRYYYGVDEDLDVEHFTKDQAMFVGQLYTNEDNEQGFGHFYNGG